MNAKFIFESVFFITCHNYQQFLLKKKEFWLNLSFLKGVWTLSFFFKKWMQNSFFHHHNLLNLSRFNQTAIFFITCHNYHFLLQDHFFLSCFFVIKRHDKKIRRFFLLNRVFKTFFFVITGYFWFFNKKW